MSVRPWLVIALAVLVPCTSAVHAQDWDRAVAVGQLVGRTDTVEVGPKDTLVGLALRHGVGYVELRAANPDIDPWLPGTGEQLTLPRRKVAPAAAGAAVVVNRAEMRLYVYQDDVHAWNAPISLGRSGYQTPLGRMPIGQKKKHPNWYPTQSHREENPELPRVVPSGPDNPLGDHAVRLGHTAYLLHGTNRPMSIGRQVSRGCIRLYPADIARLFEDVAVGMEVKIIDAPVKLALHDRRLYLEVAPSADQVRAYDFGLPVPKDPYRRIEEVLTDAAADLASQIDWAEVARIAAERRGVPEPISAPLSRSLGAEFGAISASSG